MGSPRKQIRLHKENGSWIAVHYVNGMPDDSIIELFGTHKLPTAYTDQASAEMVVSELSAKNPGVSIIARVG